jgi:hypothetical protein
VGRPVAQPGTGAGLTRPRRVSLSPAAVASSSDCCCRKPRADDGRGRPFRRLLDLARGILFPADVGLLASVWLRRPAHVGPLIPHGHSGHRAI